MAKRKRKGGYASKRAAELADVRRAEQTKNTLRLAGIIVLVTVGIILLYQFVVEPLLATAPEPSAATALDESERPLASLDPAEREGYFAAAPEMIIDTSSEYEAIIRTEKGDMRFELFDDEAPLTVNNFVFLAQQGYYDDTTFHRVLNNFMAQAGDPTGTGGGGPGYQFADEIDPNLTFDQRGLLAMANAGPGTNGSQFFITHVPTPHLNGLHTIFGRLVEGDDVLSAIRLRDPGRDPEPGDVIERIDIIEK